MSLADRDRDLARAYAAARVAFGAVLLVAPRLGVNDLVGSVDRRAKMVGRMLAARDLVIGLGSLAALDGAEPRIRPWATYAAVADGVDAASIVLAYKQLPPRRRVVMLLLSAGGAAWGGYLSRG